MTGFAMPVDIAMTGPLMANMRDTRFSHDLVFSVSTDYSWTTTTDRDDIAMSLDRFMSRLWGVEGTGAPAPTSFLMRPDLVRVYLVPERNVVSWNPQANLCDWRVPGISWADATAILHKTNCRDNASTSSRSFSAKLNARDVILQRIQQMLHERVVFAPIWELAFLNGYGPRVAESGLTLIPGHPYSAPYEDLKLKGK